MHASERDLASRRSAAEYTLTKPLGKGGMGQVWAALKRGEAGMQMPCAIKVLWPALAMTEEDRERFYGEARIAAQLDHGRIVKVIDTTIIQGSPSLIMEWVDGVNLRDLLEKARAKGMPLSVNAALYIVGEILAALSYAHGRTVAGESAAVIHSDVTPGNILISSSGEVKLTDFGIARFVRGSEQTMSQAIGTPRYMAPEQMRGRIYTATDLYSLGVVLHELLAGERYLKGCTTEQHQLAVLAGTVPELGRADVPEWLDGLRRRMLSLDHRERPEAEDAHAMIVELAPNYALGALELKRLYQRCVGHARSGFTQLLEDEHKGDADLFFKAVFGQPGPASSPASTPLEDATRVEAVLGSADDPDAPKALRRAGPASAEPATTHPTRTLGPVKPSQTPVQAPVHNSVEEAVDATTLLPGPEPESAPMLLPSAAPSLGSSQAPSLVVTQPADLVSTSTPDVVKQPSIGRAETQPPASVRTEGGPRSSKRLGLVVGAAALCGAAFVSLLVLAVTSDDEPVQIAGVDPSGAVVAQTSGAVEDTTSDVKSVRPEPDLQPEGSTDSVEPGVASESAQGTDTTGSDESTESGEAVELDRPIEADEQGNETVVAPEIEKVETKRKPAKKAAPPTVKVTFLVLSASKSKPVRVRVGSKQLESSNGFTKANLRPGTYKVAWRLESEATWHAVGSLTVESGLPTGAYYSATLQPNTMQVKKTVGGP